MKEYELIIFIIVGFYVSVYDIKYKIIPDYIILPSIAILLIFKFLNSSLAITHLYSILFIITIFVLPIVLGFRFGGGDIRFGIFSSILLGFPNIAWFILLSASLHLLILLILKKKEYPFAPSMFLATIVVYFTNEILWSFI